MRQADDDLTTFKLDENLQNARFDGQARPGRHVAFKAIEPLDVYQDLWHVQRPVSGEIRSLVDLVLANCTDVNITDRQSVLNKSSNHEKLCELTPALGQPFLSRAARRHMPPASRSSSTSALMQHSARELLAVIVLLSLETNKYNSTSVISGIGAGGMLCEKLRIMSILWITKEFLT